MVMHYRQWWDDGGLMNGMGGLFDGFWVWVSFIDNGELMVA